ncbi:MAG: argininosuccinate synthase, partial [Woeseiaceae bacterium]
IDAKQEFFDTVIRHLIAGNVLRGQAYPLCVGAERGLQAERLAKIATERVATTVAHGCTAAGNDQVRFEVALRTLNPNLESLAPVRDNSWVREEQLQYLEKNGLPLPAQGSAYSINRGLWGITIGGKETLTSENSIPESAWVLSANAFNEPKDLSQHTLEFKAGEPVALDGESLSPVRLIEKLEVLAGSYGIGRGIHLGDTVLGTKGRVAFEAPAAITLITAHRELEKLVLSAQQARIKDTVAAVYGDLVHEGKQLDLACDDIEALLTSSQKRVTGSVRFVLRPGTLFIEGVTSPHSLLAATRGVYGESAGEWTASDAVGYARILSLTGSLQTRAAGNTS